MNNQPTNQPTRPIASVPLIHFPQHEQETNVQVDNYILYTFKNKEFGFCSLFVVGTGAGYFWKYHLSITQFVTSCDLLV